MGEDSLHLPLKLATFHTSTPTTSELGDRNAMRVMHNA